MKLEGDIESGPAPFQGFKLPLDGKLGFNLPTNFAQSRQLAAEFYSKSKENIRPWSTFFASSRFKTPMSAQRLPRRIVKNVEYFQSNYILVFAVLFLYCLITSPLLLIALFAKFCVLYWLHLRNQTSRVVVFGHSLTLIQQYCIVGLVFLPIFYIVGAGAALFWVLGASCFLIMVHASFYDVQSILEPEDESFELKMERVVWIEYICWFYIKTYVADIVTSQLIN